VATEPFLSSDWFRVCDLRIKLRSHIRAHRHRYRGSSWYVVYDELSGRQYRFTPSVYMLIGLMDGLRTVDRIWKDVVARLGDDAPSQPGTIRLLAQLHSADLLQSDVSPDAAEMFERFSTHAKSTVRGRFSNPLAIKLGIFDPDAFLTWSVEWTGRFAARWWKWLWAAAVIPAFAVVLMHWPELSNNFTDRVLSGENLVLIALIYPVVKALHEFGHGYVTKFFGGAVHEFGVTFLVFVPVPYVDASSSVAFRSKWHRALVAAAGILTETFVAALAAIVWVNSEPGTVRAIAYNTMLIAGVSTLVFNGNPLLRFDGYYILCDVLEIPNLAGRAARFWGWLIERFCFGFDVETPNATTSERFWLLVYAPAALAYRLVVLFGISIFIASNYMIVGVVIAVWGVFASIVLPLMKALGHVMRAQRRGDSRLRAGAVIGAAIVAVVLFLFVIPFPLHTIAEGVVWLPDESIIRAETDGFVKELVASPGEKVATGQLLVDFFEPSEAARIKLKEAEVEALKARLASEEFNNLVQADLTRQEIAIKSAGLDQERSNYDRLDVRSQTAGYFVVPRAGDLPGRFYRRGDVVGYVTPTGSHIVRVVVTQDDIELVRNHLRSVSLLLIDHPRDVLAASILREVPAASNSLPSKALAEVGGGRLASDPRDNKEAKTLQGTFQFDLALPPGAKADAFGERAVVRFDHGNEALGFQWYRRLRQLFLSRFDA
jgi:putative peptide zinc metalloprotease protein